MSARRRDWCKHYRAMSENETCLAGVEYKLFKGTGSTSCPCWEKQPHEPCAKAEYRTPQEIAEAEAEMSLRFQKIVIAREAIVNHLGGPWKRGTGGSVGKIPCPVCRAGELKFSRAALNGHIHAGCTTKGCVNWME